MADVTIFVALLAGANSTEDYLRRNGLGVIHGGERSLRFTPIFDITKKEVDLIVSLTKDALLNGPTHSID